MKYEEMTEAQRRDWGFIKLSKEEIATINLMRRQLCKEREDSLRRKELHLFVN